MNPILAEPFSRRWHIRGRKLVKTLGKMRRLTACVQVKMKRREDGPWIMS